MEILDNMPHDRLYKDTEDIREPWKYQTMVKQIQKNEEGFGKDSTRNDVNGVIYEEEKQTIDDQYCQLFVELQKSMPEMDNVTVLKELERQGWVNRAVESWRNLTGRKQLK
jgi:hypothetical protein